MSGMLEIINIKAQTIAIWDENNILEIEKKQNIIPYSPTLCVGVSKTTLSITGYQSCTSELNSPI